MKKFKFFILIFLINFSSLIASPKYMLNGEFDAENNYPFVYALHFDVTESKKEFPLICSSTAINDGKSLITARHCFIYPDREIKKITVSNCPTTDIDGIKRSEEILNEQPEGVTCQVFSIIPDCSNQDCNKADFINFTTETGEIGTIQLFPDIDNEADTLTADIALINLPASILLNYIQIGQINLKTEIENKAIVAKKDLIVIGYGYPDLGKKYMGESNHFKDEIDSYIVGDKNEEIITTLNFLNKFSRTAQEDLPYSSILNPGANIDFGDSGGSLLLKYNDETFLVGVTSGFVQSKYNNYQFFTRLDHPAVNKWLAETSRLINGTKNNEFKADAEYKGYFTTQTESESLCSQMITINSKYEFLSFLFLLSAILGLRRMRKEKLIKSQFR